MAEPVHRLPPLRSVVGRALAYGAAVAALLAVFAFYTRPEFLVQLADQMWACFQ